MPSNRSLPPERECLSTQTAYHNGKETAPTPALKGGASAPEKGEEGFGVGSASVWTQDGRARRDRRDPSRERDDHQYYRATTAHVLRSCSGPLSAVWDADCAVCVPYGIEGPSARLEACWCWGETSQAIAGQHQYASAHQGVRWCAYAVPHWLAPLTLLRAPVHPIAHDPARSAPNQQDAQGREEDRQPERKARRPRLPVCGVHTTTDATARAAVRRTCGHGA